VADTLYTEREREREKEDAIFSSSLLSMAFVAHRLGSISIVFYKERTAGYSGEAAPLTLKLAKPLDSATVPAITSPLPFTTDDTSRTERE